MTKIYENRRTLGKRMKGRRYELATLAAVSAAAAACSNGGTAANVEGVGKSSSALITTAQGTVSAQKAIDFMVPDAIAFTQANACLSCHRQPDTLISASISAQLLPGVTLDTSAETGTGFIANLVTGNQQDSGQWTDSGSTLSMSGESLWALAGYARAGGPIDVLPNVKRGLLWLVPQASNVTFPNDSVSFAGAQRTYLNNDFVDSPQMFDWFLPTAQSVFATRVLLDLDKTLAAANVSTLSAQQASYTDALQGTTMRALATSTVQQLALTAIAMAESGRASTADARAIGAQLLAVQTAASGWSDPRSPDGTLAGVNTLTTGQALYALCRLGFRPRVNAQVGAGLDWLISQQQDDGSWLLPPHNSAVSSSWALLAVACVSNALGTAEFDPLTANGSPSAPVSESFRTVLNVTNTAADARVASIVIKGGPPGAVISLSASSLTLAGDASAAVMVNITLPAGLPANTSYPFIATVAFASSGDSAASQVSATYTTAIGSVADVALTATTTSFANFPTLVNIGSTVPFTAGVTDSAGRIVHAGSMTYALDGQVFATVPVTGDGFVTSYLVPKVPVGNHTLHAAYLGSSDAIVFGASHADKTLDVEPPVPPAPVVAGITNHSSSTSGQYNMSGAGTPGDTISIVANGVVVRTATIGPDGTWGASFSLNPGAYTLGVVETGPGGASSATTSQVTVLPTAPTVGGPAAGTTFTTMMTTVSGVATPGATVNVLRGGEVVATTTAGDDGSYSVGVNLVPGPNQLSVSQTVNAQTSALGGVTYNQTPSAPQVASPVDPVSQQKAAPLTITGTAVPGATVVLLDNGVVVGTVTAGADGTYSITARLSAGQNSLSVQSSVGGVPGAPSRAFVVRVDSDPPFFPAPRADLFAYAPSHSGVPVSWPSISAYDAQDGQLGSTCVPKSGSTFPTGSTKVTCTAVDSLGNSASSSFVVKVVLQVLPTIALPENKNIVVKTAIATGANVSFDVTAKDAQGKPIAAVCTPASGSFFAAGTTKVTCNANDEVAQTVATSSFDVTVIPVPYLGANPASTPTTPAAGSGGCSMSHTPGSTDLGALAAVGIALAAARRRRRQNDVD